MIYFTSDWHLGETRLGDIRKEEFNPFFRSFNTVEEQDSFIIQKVNEFVQKADFLYHLGDVAMNAESLEWLDCVRCKNRVLVAGNYDEPHLDLLSKYFMTVQHGMRITDDDSQTVFNLTHCPTDAVEDMFNIVGHIHSLWKVKRNMVNVGVDAWHFKPVSLKEILFVKNAIEKGFYDENVFYKEEK